MEDSAKCLEAMVENTGGNRSEEQKNRRGKIKISTM